MAGAFIYFLQAPSGGLIKIGRTLNLPRLVADMARLKSPSVADGALRLLASLPGDAAIEQELQQRFLAFRRQGEWFEPATPLLDFIATVAAAPPAPTVGEPAVGAPSPNAVPALPIGAPTIDSVIAATLQNLGSAESRRGYASDWRRYADWLRDQNVELLEARPNAVRAYVTWMRERKLKRPTIARALSVIREIYSAFVVEELIEVNPAREIKNPRVQHTPRAPCLTAEEVRQLFSLPSPSWRLQRDRIALCLLFGLGWRREEVAALRIESFERGQVSGIVKGNKSLTVGVPNWLQGEIADWLIVLDRRVGAILPRSETDHRKVSGKKLYDIVKDSARRVGLPLDRVTPHGLRRTKITLEGIRGVSLKERQLAVGHGSSVITERYDRARDAAAQAPGQVLADLVRRDNINND